MSDNIIWVPEGTDSIEFACTLNTLYVSMWPNGDRVQVACQSGTTARITRLDNTNLPPLPAGYQYVSAFQVELFRDGEQVPLDGGYLLASFIARHENPQYDILYWDEASSEWIVLNGFQLNPNGAPVAFPLDPSNPDDLRKILSGVQQVDTETPPRTEVKVDFTGIFVLVQR